ncbi:PREDICTED: olfactory receptor 1C1-like [Nanorana parkeri]|uniref:olfactory receptor 1C1-like n=1 Tax=Nanorana parkeri TaxID=125878 RepID=UPI00085483C8|nr:PREDICTED: olfactory receptor 1C1-like [Nanorana parkeri]
MIVYAPYANIGDYLPATREVWKAYDLRDVQPAKLKPEVLRNPGSFLEKTHSLTKQEVRGNLSKVGKSSPPENVDDNIAEQKRQLHTPMYVLMGNLAFVDVFFTSIIIPRALYGLLSGDTHISTHGCFVQQFLFLAVGLMDSLLLVIMAFDRYSAVCSPLRYLIIMNKRTCICLVASSWVLVCLHATLYTVLTSSQLNCSWVIHHFFCDLPVIMMLSCSGTSDALQKVVFIEGPIVIFGPVVFILGSYILIIRAVLTLHSSQGRWKTFSTCSSHLIMVIFFYSTVIFMYFRPSSIYSPTNDRVISVVYSVIIPMLNPFIYSLRNKEVKAAVKRSLQRIN